MTTPSPDEVRNVYFADIYDVSVGFINVEPLSIEWSADQDRMTYGAATVVFPWLDEDVWALLDPRSEPANIQTVRWRVEQWGDVGGVDTMLAQFPAGGVNSFVYMNLRTTERDWLERTVTVTLATGESRLEDKTRVAGTVLDTGAANISTLVQWAISGVFAGYSYSADGEFVDAAIPAGDRRLHLQGESYLDLIVPELDGVNCRLINQFTGSGNQWLVRWRDKVTSVLRLSTITVEQGAPSDADPIVFGIREVVSRDGNFADGVLAKYSYRNSGGTQVVEYQASGLGANTKGIQVDFDRPAPVQNAAEQIVSRSRTRGRDIVVEARLRLDAEPYQNLVVTTTTGILSAVIRSITYRPDNNTMTIQARTGDALA